MSIYLQGPGQLYCSFCDFGFYGWPPVFEHPRPTDAWVDEGDLKTRMEKCPHSGKKFYYPELVQIMDNSVKK